MNPHLVLVALLAFAQTSDFQTSTARTVLDLVPDVTGKWESVQWNLDVWVLELKSTKTTLTGTVSVIPGAERSTASGPMEIYDGKIDVKGIEFKVKSPDGMRVIRFSGFEVRNEIKLTRTVELLRPDADPGANDIFGKSGPAEFVVKKLSQLPKKLKNIIQ